jgi:uncharacterized protein (DUF4213/DUF364 family)
MTKCCSHAHQSALAVNRPAEGRERQLIDELIQSMDYPSAVIAEIAVGSHFIGIRADDNGQVLAGLASTLGAVPTDEERQMADHMVGKPLGEAVEQLKSRRGFSISIGAAALNTGIASPQHQPDFEASKIMAEKGRDGETVLVGDFPFTNWLRQQVNTLHLFELQKVAGRTPPDQWDAILGRCSVLGLTGTTLLTRAMATYLEKTPQAYTVIIGPTTPLSPVLFSHGADVLAGSQVVSPGPVFDGIRQGLSFRDFKKLGIQFVAWSKGMPSS